MAANVAVVYGGGAHGGRQVRGGGEQGQILAFVPFSRAWTFSFVCDREALKGLIQA